MMEDLKLKDLIYIEKILTDEQCDAIIKEREDRDKEKHMERSLNSFTGAHETSTFEQVVLRPETENFNIIHDASEIIIKKWLDYLESFNSFAVYQLRTNIYFSHAYRILRYKQGHSIHPHTDWRPSCLGSLSIALNDESEYDGGDFVFFNQHKIRLKKGEAMVFPANPFFVHEVKEVKEGIRYSVNSFLEMLNIEDGKFAADKIYERIDFYKKNYHPFSPWQYKLGD